ncbi:MAG: MBL fold metallo-hydrolase [Clostridia bacterium]
MKITKYHQSCLLVEANEKRILVDPGNIGYIDKYTTFDWTNIDCILITHKHDDHCLDSSINMIAERDNAVVYTTNEVFDAHSLMRVSFVKAGDVIDLDKVKVGVVKAMHGYLPAMKGHEVKQNVGYIIDDGRTRLYITSDTIGFSNEYKCDIIAMPFNGNGITFGIYDGLLFAKDTCAKMILPIHTEHPNAFMNPDLELLKNSMEEMKFSYKILEVEEKIEL